MAAGVVSIGTENAAFQQLLALCKSRNKRHRLGQCLVEGVNPINLALRYSWEVTGLLQSEGATLSGWARDVIASCSQATLYKITPDLMKKISDKEETSEIIAVVKIAAGGVERIHIRETPLLVVVDQPQSPGNLGSLIRSCDAFSVDGVVVVGHSADIYDPQTIRASLGTVFSTPVVRIQSTEHLLQWLDILKREYPGLRLVGTSSRADDDLRTTDFRAPVVLVFGNETHGISWNFRHSCDLVVRIPIAGAASSINLACAASISLYEVKRQRSGEPTLKI